jgi:putative ABC transport system ATP-binding protein
MPAMIQLDSICKSYTTGQTRLDVLKDVCLTIDAGELLSIVGRSGSGKSTLMNIIGLLDRPTSGNYLLNGIATGGLENDRLAELRRRHIGFVFQFFHLLPRLTAVENAALPLRYGEQRMTAAERQRQAAGWLERVGLGKRLHHFPSELSGGECQRVAIARALIGNPALLLADEPTGALDTATGQEIMHLLRQLNADQGLTTIIITHDPAVARQCHRHIGLHDGRIVPPSADYASMDDHGAISR